MRRPSLQFYPDDWRNNANLRRCSWAARGAWVEVMCLMHDSDRYGILEWPLKEIAQALGCPIALLRELVEKGVLKGCDAGACEPLVYRPRSGRREGVPVVLVAAQPGPVWFSSRMVRDEHVRLVRGDVSRFGAAPDAAPPHTPAASPIPPFGERQGVAPNPAPSRRQGDGSSTSSSSSPSGKSNREGISDPPGVGARAHGAHADATPLRKPHRIPDGWRAPPDLLALARDRGVDVEEEEAVFTAYWRGEAGPKARKLDWDAAFRVWLSRATTRRPDGGRRRDQLPDLRGSIFDEPPPATRTFDGRPIIEHGEV